MLRTHWESLTKSEQLFAATLLLTLLFKLIFAAWLPLTGDEAYFYIWGKYPALGYYDHPPMVGWWLALLTTFSKAVWWLRLPSILLATFIGWGIYKLLRERGREMAALAASIWLIAPVSWYNVLITTDTPLVLFCFLSIWSMQRALTNERAVDYLLAGAFLGLAFLSKYFAVFLGFAYLGYFLINRRSAAGVKGFLLMLVATVPFIAIHFYWNYAHCWTNLLFNFFNRHDGDRGGISGLLGYLGVLLYLAAPLFYYGFRHRKELELNNFFAVALWVPLGLFFLLSFKARVGLHWVLAFYPLLFLVFSPLLSNSELKKSFRFMGVLSLLHLLLLGVIVFAPLDLWHERSPKTYNDLVFGLKNEQFSDRMLPYADDYTFGTRSYVRSAILEHATGERFIVFGGGGKHARQDDLSTDYRKLDGGNILLQVRKREHAEEYGKYFSNHRIEHFSVDKHDAWLFFGHGFDYQLYREEVLSRVKARYYDIPAWLPAGKCSFIDNYWPDLGKD